MDIKTSPSLLACDFLHLEDEIKKAENSGCDMLHCDVMDGVYVPNISFGFDIIKKIHTVTTLPLDVHMMTSRPQNYIEVLADAGAAAVSVHNDSVDKGELIRTLEKIKSCGMSASVAINPSVPAEDILDLVPLCDKILVMSVNAGFGGQKFIPEVLDKVRAVREYLDKNKPECEIEIDGGVNAENAENCARAGVNIFVVGTSFFKSTDSALSLRLIKESACRGKNKI